MSIRVRIPLQSPTNWPLGAERALLADSCFKRFWPFVKYAFGVSRNPGGAWLDEGIHKPLCDWLEGIANEWFEMRASGVENQRRFYILIDAARNSGKTVIVTKAFTMWLHLRDPDLASDIDSVTMTKAIEHIEPVKKVYEGKDPCALFPWLYGKWEGFEPWTKTRLTHRARRLNRSEASIETTSVETGVTGDHPDHIGVDDPISRDKLRESGNFVQIANTHVGALFPAMKNNSLLVLCATPYLDGDVVTNAIMVDGVCEVIGRPLPVEYRQYVRPTGKWRMYFMPGADEEGNTLMPKSWPQAELDDYRRKFPAEYAAQVCLRPGAGDNVPLTMEQIEDRLIDSKQVPRNLSYTIHCDTAFKNPDNMGQGDSSVIQVWGHHAVDGDVYYLEGYGSNRWRTEDFTNKLIEIVQRYRREGRQIRYITDEVSVGGKGSGKEGAWQKHLQSCFSNANMWLPPFLEINRRSGPAKVQRIAETAGYWVDGHVYLVRGAPGLGPLMWQMARIGISEHDDWSDAAADVFHPMIYCPFLPGSADVRPPVPVRPGDYYLKTGKLDNDSATEMYDEYSTEEWRRSPIG